MEVDMKTSPPQINPSNVIVTGGVAYAVGLQWQALIGHGSVESQLTQSAGQMKATQYLRYVPPNNVSDEEAFGFYVGKVPNKIEGVDGKGKKSIHALAAIFAQNADRESFFIYAYSETNYGILGCKNNHPIIDQINLSEKEVIDAASEFKLWQGERGATLYYDNSVPDTVITTLRVAYPSNKMAPDEFLKTDKASVLKNVPQKLPITIIVIATMLCLVGYMAYDSWETKQTSLQAMKSVIGVNQLYENERNKVLDESGRVSTPSFIQQIRNSQEWVASSGVAGWHLVGMRCSFAGTVQCIRSWQRRDGVIENLSKSLNKKVTAESIDVGSDVLIFEIPKFQLNIKSLNDTETERLRWLSWMQELKTKASALSDEKLKHLNLDMAMPQLLGQWSVGQPPTNAPELVSAGIWSVEGDLFWMQKLAELPAEFLLSNLVIGTDKNTGAMLFKASGIYLTRGL